LTSDKLIEVLTPPTRMRGIAPTAAEKPHCEAYRTEVRGTDPVADVAAIKVLFAFNSTELSPEAVENLTKLGTALKSSELASYCFRIEGHADSVGGTIYNRNLSEKRAESVVRYLATQVGVEKERLIAVGYGEDKPLAENETEEGRQKNRRVQIANLGTGGPSNP